MNSNSLLRSYGPWIGLALFLVLIPLTTDNDFYLNLFVFVFIYAGLATAWALIGGLAGQFSLGHTAFFGVGAYTSTLMYVYGGISPWIGMLAGGILAVILASIISLPAFRLRGVFFTMASLAAAEVVRILVIYFRRRVDIPYGISINYEPSWANMIFEGRLPYVYLALGYMLIVLAIFLYFSRSHIGYYLAALKDNEEAAAALGVPTYRYKLLAMLVSAFMTAVGGTLYVEYILYIEPDSVFAVGISVQLPLMAILGGVNTAAGPLLGAAIVLPLQEFLQVWFGSAASGAYLMVYGLVLIVIVLLMPDGIIGELINRYRRRQLARMEQVSSDA